MAALTWGAIKDWNGDDLNDTLNGLAEDRKKAADVSDSIDDIDVESGWEGEGADAAREAVGKLKDSHGHYGELFDDLLAATKDAQDGVNDVKKLVDAARALADEHHLTISDDGTVTVNLTEGASAWYGASGSLLGALGSIKSGLGDLVSSLTISSQQCETFVDLACEKATEVDSAYVKALSNISKGRLKSEELAESGLSGLPGLPGRGASSKEVAGWWYSLTDKERQEIRDRTVESIRAGHVSEYEKLGNMDGIDASTRSEINKARVDRDLEALRKEGLKNGDRKFDELRGIKEVMNERRDVGLYLYDPPRPEDGHRATHAAYAIGDVDKAAHVTTFVPGMTTSVANSLGNVDSMRDLRGRAEAEGKGDVAAIAWLGYDAPPFPTSDLSVFSTHDAELGGNSLAKHLEGIEDSRTALGQPVHQSVLGHSYGSTTSSYGVSQVRPGVVDDYAVFGSPGVKDTAQAMHVPEGHSYAMLYKALPLAPDVISPVNDLGRGITSDSTAALGKDPMDRDSGFKTIKSHRSGSFNPLDVHKRYLYENSNFQADLARVVVGTAG
jgi:hypothetical protein